MSQYIKVPHWKSESLLKCWQLTLPTTGPSTHQTWAFLCLCHGAEDRVLLAQEENASRMLWNNISPVPLLCLGSAQVRGAFPGWVELLLAPPCSQSAELPVCLSGRNEQLFYTGRQIRCVQEYFSGGKDLLLPWETTSSLQVTTFNLYIILVIVKVPQPKPPTHNPFSCCKGVMSIWCCGCLK